MKALLELTKDLKEMENSFDFTSRLAYTEELKDSLIVMSGTISASKMACQLVLIGSKKRRSMKKF